MLLEKSSLLLFCHSGVVVYKSNLYHINGHLYCPQSADGRFLIKSLVGVGLQQLL